MMVGLGLVLACSADTPPADGLDCVPLNDFSAYDYDASKLPRAELPVDEASWSELPMPLPLEGWDNGDRSMVYGAALAGYYMMRMQRPVTCQDRGVPCFPFGYQYDPREDTWSDEDMIHRQIVATFAQTWLYKVTRRPEFRLSAEAAIQSLMPRMRVRGSQQRMHDIGASALMVMALTHHGTLTGDRSRDAAIDGLGVFILDKVRPDGSFRLGGPLQWYQLHQALWRLWDYTGNARYLDALVFVGRYGFEHRDERGAGEYLELPYLYGLWALEPLTELYQVRPEESWIPEMVYLVGDWVLSKQYTADNAKRCRWLGGYMPNNDRGHPNWNHTLKLEAMADAWRFAELHGDEERAAVYRASALKGADFALRFQHRRDETDRYLVPGKALGGIPLYGDNPSVRVDVPGHGSIAILKVASYSGIEDFAGALD